MQGFTTFTMCTFLQSVTSYTPCKILYLLLVPLT